MKDFYKKWEKKYLEGDFLMKDRFSVAPGAVKGQLKLISQGSKLINKSYKSEMKMLNILSTFYLNLLFNLWDTRY